MVLEFKNIGFSYNKENILFDHFSFSLKECEVLNVLGMNGTGKTTFAKCILNVITTYKGAIFIDGLNLRNLSIRQKARYIGYMGVGSDIPSNLTVFEYVLLGVAAELNMFAVPTVKEEHRVIEALEYMQCRHLRDKKMCQLSQGEQQMVSLARILVQNPSIIILDEPMASLDLNNQGKMLRLIKRLQKDNHIIINITHNPNHAFGLQGYSLLLFKERYLIGDVFSVMTEKNLSDLYETKVKIIEDDIVGKIVAIIGEDI